ncbi:hypothetical protein RF11_02410 [Thelohanellus kitauei]|uniref:Uncharacterized protein n=1 Tax=Thelohanellus kitauei TaxID=669202 RepID=A0A0C2JQL7_THEKT|nr:hypothetical protein RF11_02410 [Thelohanellus kitauei]
MMVTCEIVASRHKIECSRTRDILHPGPRPCYISKEMSDYFKNCTPDDLISKGDILCPEAFYIECQINDQRVCISKMCDGFEDCQDGSDENKFCHSQNFSRTINVDYHDNGYIEFSWRAEDPGSSFEVTIVDIIQESIFIKEVVKQARIKVGGHVNCGEYTIIAKNTISYNIQFETYQYLQTKSYAPINLAYDSNNQTLKWDFDAHTCVPRIFYIECHSNMRIKRTFTIQNWYKIESMHELECKVAACPRQIFNQSCSPFAEIIYPFRVRKPVVPMFMITIIIISALIILYGLSIPLRICINIKIHEFSPFKNLKFFKKLLSR